MFTRKEIIDYSVRMGCNRDLTQKGMVTTPYGDVFCLATLREVYPDGVYYRDNQKSPKEALYCGVYGIRAAHRLDPTNYETRKNIAVIETKRNERYVYFFEKTDDYSKEYFFHGRYKYLDHKIIPSDNPDRKEEIEFLLLFVDRPILK